MKMSTLEDKYEAKLQEEVERTVSVLQKNVKLQKEISSQRDTIKTLQDTIDALTKQLAAKEA